MAKMLIMVGAAIAALAPTLTQAQTTHNPSPTKALVNMVVAEQFCRIEAPQPLVLAIGDRALAETGLDMSTLVDASYIAAMDIGNAYRTDGRLPDFCLGMAQIYSRGGW